MDHHHLQQQLLQQQGHGGGGEMTRRNHEAALRAVQKPPAKPWRAGGGSAPTPPKVYRVEPREFRDLVQRLTGAAPPPHVVAPTQPVAVRARPADDMYAAAPWCSFPLPGPASVNAHHGM